MSIQPVSPSQQKATPAICSLTKIIFASLVLYARTDHNPLGRFGATVGVAVSGAGAVTGVVEIGAARVSVVGANVIA